ncbi:MAG: M20/M25/M40 family metallo-hydrolase [Thermoanaerobaculia bacterium]
MVAGTERLPGDNFAATRSLLVDLCAISSESGNAAGLRRVASRLAGELERHGLQVEMTDERDARGESQPVLLARGPSAAQGHLLLVGHMDTVLPAREPKLEADRLHATGALDMKGGLAMLVGALDALAADGRKVPADLVLLAVPDEEAEGAISTSAMRKWSERARTVLVLEPGMARPDGETLVAGRRGLTEWKLETTGKAAHSGLAYWQGRSALGAAADWCLRAQRLSAPGPGRTVNVARLVAGSTDFVDALGANIGLLGTSRQLNVVSDRAVAEGEARYLTAAEGTSVITELGALAERVASEHGVSVRFTPGASIPPVDPHGPGAALARRVVELAAARGFHLEIEEDRGGVSFPNFLADPGRIPVVDGLGPAGDGMHTREEWLDLRSLERRIVLFADLLATL